MIDRYLVKAAVSALEAKGHPSLAARKCVNFKQGKTRCRTCHAACPQALLLNPEKGENGWDTCVDCDLCAVVCPSGALGLSSAHFQRALALCALERPVLVLGCDQAACALDYTCWCLASIPWEMICLLALAGRVELVRGACADCARKDSLCVYERTLSRARAFLGDERFDARVAKKRAEDASPVEVTRREAFGALFSGLRRTVDAALPQEEAPRNDGLFFRRLLVHRLLALDPDAREHYGWVGPEISARCWACGICAKVCPNEALSVVERGGVRYIIHQSCLCTACGACAAVCPDQAITGIAPRTLKANEHCVATRTASGTCPDCGAATRPGEDGQNCQRCRARKGKRPNG